MKTSVQLRSGVQAPARPTAAVPGAPETLLPLVLAGIKRVLAELETTEDGLSADQARVRLARAGPNLLPQARGPSLARQLFEAMFHFFALMLWAAAGLAFVGGMPQLGVAIILVVVFNDLFSFAQEYRAERAIRALSALLPATAVVRRDGRKTTVPASELAPGDLVLLAEGDRISADARVVHAPRSAFPPPALPERREASARAAQGRSRCCRPIPTCCCRDVWTPEGREVSVRCEIGVEGPLHEPWVSWFDGLQLTANPAA